MVAGLVMPGGFAMMLGRMLVVFGGLVVVLDACVVAHVCSPGGNVKTPCRCTQAG